jgi:uroporphyrin-III C-methyltransferase
MPVTHRDVGSAVTFVTGHDSAGTLPAVDWEAIARGSPVIVLYMSLRHLDRIAERLIAGGRSPGEPVAIVSKATSGAQRVLVTTLAAAAIAARDAAIEAPTIVAIGEIVNLRCELDWWPGGI